MINLWSHAISHVDISQYLDLHRYLSKKQHASVSQRSVVWRDYRDLGPCDHILTNQMRFCHWWQSDWRSALIDKCLERDTSDTQPSLCASEKLRIHMMHVDYRSNHKRYKDNGVHWATYPVNLHIEAETEWPPLSRRHFQIHFLQCKCMNCD